MSWIDKLENRFGGWAIPNLTHYLLGLQLIGLVIVFGKLAPMDELVLVGGKVLEGEVWRLFSFLLIPPSTHPLFLIFAYYLFYMMGTALEEEWSHFKYNLFVLIAYLATLLCAFLVPGGMMTNVFIGTSVYLAFAYLFPNFELRIMFLIPVKIKWLALLAWIGIGFSVLAGTWAMRLSAIASIANFLLFFWRDIYLSVRAGKRRMQFQAESIKTAATPLHVCLTCGISDKTDPTKEFRYCSDCGDCFCVDHISNHEHTKK